MDGSGSFRACSKDSVETVEVVEELPSPEASQDVSPSLRMAVPLSSIQDCWLIGRAAILSHMWSCVCSQETSIST